MFVMYVGWLLARRFAVTSRTAVLDPSFSGPKGFTDLVDIHTLDLKKDEHDEQPDDYEDETLRNKRLNSGKQRIFWQLYYSIA